MKARILVIDGQKTVKLPPHSFGFESPIFGDRVRIEYVKGRLGRNAVARTTILWRK